MVNGKFARPRGRVRAQMAPSLPRFGFLVWIFHPFGALQRVSRIAGSRLRSIPVTVMDWAGTVTPVQELGDVTPETSGLRAILAAPVAPTDAPTSADERPARRRAGRAAVPDELYLGRLRELVAGNGGAVPSIREVALKLSVEQDRARRLLATLAGEYAKGAASNTHVG